VIDAWEGAESPQDGDEPESAYLGLCDFRGFYFRSVIATLTDRSFAICRRE
jgi:hypothetical protein